MACSVGDRLILGKNRLYCRSFRPNSRWGEGANLYSIFPSRYLHLQVNGGGNGPLRASMALYRLQPTVTAHERLMGPEGSFQARMHANKKGCTFDQPSWSRPCNQAARWYDTSRQKDGPAHRPDRSQHRPRPTAGRGLVCDAGGAGINAEARTFHL